MVILIMAMRQITPDSLDRALGLLGELIAARGHSLQHFVVCGGSSLLALGLVKRTTTRDVDILARVGPDRIGNTATSAGLVARCRCRGWQTTGIARRMAQRSSC